MCLVLCGTLLGITWKIGDDRKQRVIDELEAARLELEARVAARERMIERMSRSRRVAHLEVLDQQYDDRGRINSTTVRLIELDDDGAEIGRSHFTVPGDVIMVDALTIKFHFDQVADGHPLAGHTLLLLRRFYSDRMRPVDGFPIDTPGAVPPAYAVGALAEFQQQLWSHFWELATDAEAAEQMGVRVAQGEVVYKPVKTGQSFELVVDSTGGMNLSPTTIRGRHAHAAPEAGEPGLP